MKTLRRRFELSPMLPRQRMNPDSLVQKVCAIHAYLLVMEKMSIFPTMNRDRGRTFISNVILNGHVIP